MCREHDLSQALVRRWREQYAREGENAWAATTAPHHGAGNPQRRVAALEAALGRAHLEIELLRRALDQGGPQGDKQGS